MCTVSRCAAGCMVNWLPRVVECCVCMVNWLPRVVECCVPRVVECCVHQHSSLGRWVAVRRFTTESDPEEAHRLTR